MQQRGVVDEVGGDHREVRHAQHRGVDSHTVPRHLRMRGRRTAERHGRKGGAAVLFDENRRVESQDVRHRECDVFMQYRSVELGFWMPISFIGRRAVTLTSRMGTAYEGLPFHHSLFS